LYIRDAEALKQYIVEKRTKGKIRTVKNNDAFTAGFQAFIFPCYFTCSTAIFFNNDMISICFLLLSAAKLRTLLISEV